MANAKSGGPADESLWTFCTDVYSAPGIEHTCLQLQDTCGVNVLILLWCSWLEAQGETLSPDQFAEVLAWTDCVHRETVVPVRAIRRALKNEARLAPQAIQNMRSFLLQAELTAERELLSQLEKRQLCEGGRFSSLSRPLELFAEHYQLPPEAQALEQLRRASTRYFASN